MIAGHASGSSRLVAASALVAMAALGTASPVHADNRRLNNSVVDNVFAMQHQAGCTPTIKTNPKLRLAAQWHTHDVLTDHSLEGDVGSDNSTVADRARNAGYQGPVAETVAINPALSINGIEIINQWYYRPDYAAIMRDCGNIDIGVWSDNSFNRSVVVAVYGKGDSSV